MENHVKDIFTKFRLPLLLTLVMWLLKAYEYFSGNSLAHLGIFPRKIEGLLGIVISPFLHSTWQHLLSNTFPFLMLSLLLVYFYERIALAVLVLITLTTGAFVWLIGKEGSYHIGASGVVYGLAFFHITSGFFRKNPMYMIISLLVLAINGGIFIGLAPKEGLSWESHLWGAAMGIALAFLFRNVEMADTDNQTPITDYKKPKRPFLPPDIFDKTKRERHEEYLAMLQAQEEERLRNLGAEG